MVVEVAPEIEQLVFEIASRPEQQVIQILSAKGAVLLRFPLCGVRSDNAATWNCLYGLERHITDRGSGPPKKVTSPLSSDQGFAGFEAVTLVSAMLQILQALSQEWAAEAALHHRPGSKKLIKHFRPPKLGIE